MGIKFFVDILTLDLPIDDFDINNYAVGEINILIPALESVGYTILGEWYSSEFDSFGPLIRSIKVLTPKLEEVEAFYG